MKVNVLKSNKKINIEDGFLTEAILTYIKKSKFPYRSELHKYIATQAYYEEKLKQHQRVLDEAKKDIQIIQTKVNNMKMKCTELSNRLQGNLGIQ